MRLMLEIALIAVVLSLFLIVSSMDYVDAKAAETEYRDMVCQGFWPDYDQRNPDCSQVNREAE